jgi:hypothetical protein
MNGVEVADGKTDCGGNGRFMILRWCSQSETMMRYLGSPLGKLEKMRRRSMWLILEHA